MARKATTYTINPHPTGWLLITRRGSSCREGIDWFKLQDKEALLVRSYATSGMSANEVIVCHEQKDGTPIYLAVTQVLRSGDWRIIYYKRLTYKEMLQIAAHTVKESSSSKRVIHIPSQQDLYAGVC